MTSHKPFPSNPDLRTFRNQVQSLLNAHASQDDGTPLSVEEARHAVAREYGFDDWDALRTEIEPSSTYTARSEAHKAALPPDLPEETSMEVVKALIDAGADINAGRQWRTHLGEFVTKGHLEVADLLILHGADVNQKNDRGKTTLQAMIYLPSWLERYGDPVPGIELLLANGADINTLSDDGKTVLDITIEQENDSVAAQLRERGGLRAEDLP